MTKQRKSFIFRIALNEQWDGRVELTAADVHHALASAYASLSNDGAGVEVREESDDAYSRLLQIRKLTGKILDALDAIPVGEAVVFGRDVDGFFVRSHHGTHRGVDAADALSQFAQTVTT